MDTDQVFRDSIPAVYAEYMTPMFFAPYAREMAARLRPLRPHRVLETAAGTGIVTRALAATLPEDATIEATDLSQPMLDQAARHPTPASISWRQADAQALPFPDGGFDAVVCQFGVMFFPDRPKAFAEAYRVLKPGGRFLFSVWDRIEANDFADIVLNAVAAMFPDNPVVFCARVPHGLYDTDLLSAELHAAGFTDVTVETVALVSEAPNARAVALGLCQGTPMRQEIEARDANRLGEATDAATAAVAARCGPGPVSGRLQAFILTATR
jgi:ubiquinone/menaquinone biosynthesis C-methylase UbiE